MTDKDLIIQSLLEYESFVEVNSSLCKANIDIETKRIRDLITSIDTNKIIIIKKDV